MGNVIFPAFFLAFSWLGDNWFQILAALFMVRVWIGLGVFVKLVEGLYVHLADDDLAKTLRDLGNE